MARLNRGLNQYVQLLKSAGISLAPVEAEENINNAVAKTDVIDNTISGFGEYLAYKAQY